MEKKAVKGGEKGGQRWRKRRLKGGEKGGINGEILITLPMVPFEYLSRLQS
uniref:hypothetical protein n=1 Tax=Halomonas sp. 40 TaxID=223901 RepID=UPI00159ED8DA|nr:hypothetical protein [Halomonas sp. 40]